MAMDLVIEVDNRPGALAQVAAAFSDAGVNIAAATCVGPATAPSCTYSCPTPRPHGMRWPSTSLSLVNARSWSSRSKTGPGHLADLARKVAEAGVDLDLVYVATNNRVVFGSTDLAGIRAALGAD